MRLIISVILCLSGAAAILPARLTIAEGSHMALATMPMGMQDPTPSPSPAETPKPTPDPELERLKREQAIADAEKAKSLAQKEAAEARKAAAEADKETVEANLAALKARLGIGVATPTATPPSGNITGDGANKFIETQLLAEMSARKASQLMAKNLCESKAPALQANAIKTLVIHSPADKLATDSYQAILIQLRFFADEYDRLIGEAVNAQHLPEAAPTPAAGGPANREGAEAALGALPLIIPAATQAVKSFADLVNMFRTETEFKDQQVAVDTRMITTFLADELFKKKAAPCTLEAIYNPAVYSLSIQDAAADGPIMDAYGTVVEAISRGDATVNENKLKVAELTKAIEAKVAEIAKLKKEIEENTKKSGTKPPTNTANQHAAPPSAQSATEKKPGSASKKPKKQATKEKPNSAPNKPDEPEFDLPGAKTKLSQAEADNIYLERKIQRINQTTANLEAFRASLADALKLMTGVNEAKNETVLAGLLRAERLRQILADKNTYALDIGVKASGTNRFTRTAFFNTKVAHSGGVTISLNLFNNLDQMVFGRQEGYYIEFSRSKDIRQRAGFQPLDDSFRQ